MIMKKLAIAMMLSVSALAASAQDVYKRQNIINATNLNTIYNE